MTYLCIFCIFIWINLLSGYRQKFGADLAGKRINLITVTELVLSTRYFLDWTQIFEKIDQGWQEWRAAGGKDSQKAFSSCHCQHHRGEKKGMSEMKYWVNVKFSGFQQPWLFLAGDGGLPRRPTVESGALQLWSSWTNNMVSLQTGQKRMKMFLYVFSSKVQGWKYIVTPQLLFVSCPPLWHFHVLVIYDTE